jgi:pantoate--beta-alanine ligase
MPMDPRKVKGYQVYTQIPSLRKKRHEDLFNLKTVGFVPTMGALHDGHLSLIRQAAKENHHVYVSIYVNPTQFGVNEDLDSYPQTWAADQFKLMTLVEEFNKNENVGQIAAVFAPKTEHMYPGLKPTSEINGDGSFVTITPLSSRLEGASRPVFFRGVATVCMKLLNIVQPERVYFGRKDIQQALVIKRMVEDFFVNTDVRILPTVREGDGLALSSRNVYLGARRRAVAGVLYKALKAAEEAFGNGRKLKRELVAAAYSVIMKTRSQQNKLPPHERALFEVDYISVADTQTMAELNEVKSEEGAIISGAIIMQPLEEPQEEEDVGIGGGRTPVRLIDNLKLDILGSKLGLLIR